MSDDIKYRFYRREFINKPGHHSIAFVYAYVKQNDLQKLIKEKYGYTDVCLTIGDCNRTISLSLDLASGQPKDNANNIEKVEALIDTFQQLKQAMVTENELLKQCEAIRKVQEEAEKQKKLLEGLDPAAKEPKKA